MELRGNTIEPRRQIGLGEYRGLNSGICRKSLYVAHFKTSGATFLNCYIDLCIRIHL